MHSLKALVMLSLTGVAMATVPGTGDLTNPGADRVLNNVVITESGFITLSSDGLGMIGSSGTIQVVKPSAGATVRAAYLAAASAGFSGYSIPDGCVSLAGSGVSWSASTPSGISSNNHFADVTAIVATAVAGPAMVYNLTVDECQSSLIDGEALYVIFDDPATTTYRTAIIAFGAQSTGGDTFSIGFGSAVDMSLNPVLEMGLAIGFSYQRGTCQTSYIDVNGSRLTSSAGGNDDGEDANGALMTVGGYLDALTLPAPYYEDPCVYDDFTLYDDELYDIASYVNTGDTGMSATTFNPSGDDNIFVAHMLLDFAAVVGEGAVLTPANATNCLCAPHTVTITVQDNNGNPVANTGVTIQVVAGPSNGYGLSSFTDANGQFSLTYTSCVEGTDVILASFANSQGLVQYSNYAYKHWVRCDVGAEENPEAFALSQNVPNPFNPTTTISFNMPETGSAKLVVYNMTGAQVAELFNGIAARGQNMVDFDASALPSGSYTYTLTTEFGSSSRRMTLVK